MEADLWGVDFVFNMANVAFVNGTSFMLLKQGLGSS